MKGLLKGYAQVRLTGASPESCLNRLTREGIPFWRLRREDALHFTCRIPLSRIAEAEKAAVSCLCTLQVLERHGLPVWAGGLRKRPVLLLGLAAAVLIALFLQNYVWFVRIDSAPPSMPQEYLLYQLAREGVRFGAWGPDLRTQALKNQMLERMPELRWLAVNREGCIAHILASEREQLPQPEEADPVTNIVADRAGIITDMDVYNGFAVAEVGDAVLPGQLLVTGVAEWTTHVQATRAIAEVYASTLHRLTVQTPLEYAQKTYTGREETCLTLIFQRKRIKISGNSGIFGACCDKMVKRGYLTLPGRYALPVEVEITTLREYRLQPAQLTPQEAERLLKAAADHGVQKTIIGQIENGSDTLQKEKDHYTLRAERYCRELISRTVPVTLLGEDGYSGEDHQRGEN